MNEPRAICLLRRRLHGLDRHRRSHPNRLGHLLGGGLGLWSRAGRRVSLAHRPGLRTRTSRGQNAGGIPLHARFRPPLHRGRRRLGWGLGCRLLGGCRLCGRRLGNRSGFAFGLLRAGHRQDLGHARATAGGWLGGRRFRRRLRGCWGLGGCRLIGRWFCGDLCRFGAGTRTASLLRTSGRENFRDRHLLVVCHRFASRDYQQKAVFCESSACPAGSKISPKPSFSDAFPGFVIFFTNSI